MQRHPASCARHQGGDWHERTMMVSRFFRLFRDDQVVILQRTAKMKERS